MSEDKEDEKYLEILNKAYFYSTEQFDKAVLFVSSGALALSITFIEKIVPLETAHWKLLLLISWLGEALTILLFTVNHYLSKKALNNRIKNYYKDKRDRNYDLIVKRLNFISIVTLGIGLIFLVIFIFKNI
jgi:hypothetical protein